ncbi:hypothetical protein NKH99_32235, partial [Mesorhizobium sp. M0854]|uniref:hypothetical protein n=1 Tax=Mesorhizobium sp. M0854 TaxID=2957013 RepID=UPI003337A8C4
ARRFTRPAGHNPRRKRTQNWIETGGNVTQTCSLSIVQLTDGQPLIPYIVGRNEEFRAPNKALNVAAI